MRINPLTLVCAGLLLAAQICAFPRAAGAALNAGDRAPDFELEDLTGKTVTLFDVLKEERPVVLSFFGTWCVSCIQEMKDFPESAEPHGARIFLVGVDEDKEKLERFVKKYDVKYPVLWDPKARSMGRKYDLLRGAILLVPKTIVVSPAGTVEYAADSYDEARKKALSDKLAGLKNRKWEKPAEVAVYFTGSANGRLQAAYADRKNGGGYIKLLSFLKKEEARYQNRLLLDTGDFLPYSASAAQAAAVLKAMALAGYNAAAVGDQDLHFTGLKAAAAEKNVPLLASNLALKGETPGLPEKTITAGGIKIRIVSYAASEAFSFYPEEFSGAVELKALAETLKDGKQADLLVLLSHAGIEENRKLAAEFKNIDLIIGGHSQEATFKPEKIGGKMLVQTGSNLQTVGKVVFRFDGSRRLIGSAAQAQFELFPLPESLPDDERITAILQELRAQAKKQ